MATVNTATAQQPKTTISNAWIKAFQIKYVAGHKAAVQNDAFQIHKTFYGLTNFRSTNMEIAFYDSSI